MMSYWERVDERLIKRGMLIMDLDFVGVTGMSSSE
jgi:hypothetical protein